MKKPLIRSAFTPREPVNHPLSGEPSRTKQEFKKEVNINTIIERMRKGIQPPPWMTAATPRYGDFTNMPTTFMEAHAMVEKAEEAFRSLPLDFRRALDHDPRNLDKAPRELFERYGLLKKPANAEGPNGPEHSGVMPEGQGDSVLPVKAPPGANKGAKKAPQPAEE